MGVLCVWVRVEQLLLHICLTVVVVRKFGQWADNTRKSKPLLLLSGESGLLPSGFLDRFDEVLLHNGHRPIANLNSNAANHNRDSS